MSHIKITAIITAVEKKDSLDNQISKIFDYTVGKNLNQIDEFIIATDYQSLEVERICQKYNIKFIKTNGFYENNAQFDRGKVVSAILKSIKSGWILHMDADILLPKDFKQKINTINFNKNKLYGARRILFSNLTKVKRWFDMDEDPEAVSDYIPYGYCWGYFQLFNMESPQVQTSDPENIYPSTGTVYEQDGWFRNKWGLMKENYYKKGKLFPDQEDLIVKGNIEELPFFVGHLGGKDGEGFSLS